MKLACEATPGDYCDTPWSVVATLKDAVIVKRSTGDCGGCGALTYATVFRGDAVQAHGRLGSFGRFGRGPDAVTSMDIGGARALVVDSSDSMGGYFDAERRFYWIDGREIREGTCVAMESSNTGAYDADRHWAWKATMHVNRSGAIDVRYRVTQRGASAPKSPLSALHIPADRVRMSIAEDDGCAGPAWNGDPSEAVVPARAW